MQANPERGEVEITLGDATYPMRPSYDAMVAIERSLGNLIKLYRRLFEDGDGLSCDELAVIVTESIKAAAKDRGDEGKLWLSMTRPKVAELIFEQGLVDVFEAVTPLLANMLSGGSKKKAKDPPQNESTIEP